ncbi:Protein of uncharacterised function (DUF2857) [Klebsiella variicola]|uniref:DUF2857 domain-containing protein n=1 Tax=Klebsiella variicola TaxID=244366 RepID=UPI0007CC172C|nr:DUF2857 domain-containing protein [Klebsiella variicola]ELY7231504.1 DUF2857 domain-containing protein [Klebsiella variicola]SBK83718.1 Protein of uncharacterised function (DUF2857) [Klebsiella variicola]SLP36873.1 Protein of uncharacterised function (DUF2857) [Klebsiella variicola]VAR78762.1 Protein of uncharacterised function (DUF2857) [Klebsiella variicola]HCL6960337.1 DUF2857 domain-containing protein [Klebsiella variicola]
MIPSLNYAVLTDALNALKEGDIHHCESLGFTFDEMNALNLLSVDELFMVSRATTPFVSVSIRHDVLLHLLALARQEHKCQKQINRAIRLGGSIALLNQYFGLTSNETCLRRRLLGVSVPYGRTPEPDEETDAEIWRQWQKCRVDNLKSSDALVAMMQVTEKLLPDTEGLSLTTVWKRITLCEQEAVNRRASHAG